MDKEEKIDIFDEIVRTNKAIKTKDYVNFCGGCNSHVTLERFIAYKEGQTADEMVSHRFDNAGDELHSNDIFIGRCLCGNIYWNV